MRANPITIRNLIENGWVFTLYGFLLSFLIGAFSTFDVDFELTEKLITEPLSLYAFTSLSLAGLFGLGVINLFYAKSAEEMYSSSWVTKFWVPIANTGLTTGAIISGMMLGLGVGFFPWSCGDEELRDLIKLLLFMSFFVLMLLYPLAWMKRSMFDKTKEDEKKSVWAGTIYCVIMGIIYWHAGKLEFVYSLLGLAFISAIFGVYIQTLSK